MERQNNMIVRANDGMNPFDYFEPAEIAARLNLMFNRYMDAEDMPDERKKNHWLISCIIDHFQGIAKCDDTEAV